MEKVFYYLVSPSSGYYLNNYRQVTEKSIDGMVFNDYGLSSDNQNQEYYKKSTVELDENGERILWKQI